MASYSNEELLKLCPTPEELAKPITGLLYIVVTPTPAPSAAPLAPSTLIPRSGRSTRNRSQQQRGAPRQVNVPQPRLKESENSFSAARKKRDQDEALILIGEIRQLLNKVTDDNMSILLEETKNICCPKLSALIETFDSDEQQESFLTQLAKLFVQKAQIDHAFSKWYAQIASEMVLPEFGDILYEQCRDVLPPLRYDPDLKNKYLGALLLLVELCRFKLIDTVHLEAAADRIFSALDRNMGNVIMATTTEAPIDSSAQIEICVDLLCKYLGAFFSLNGSPVEKYVQQLQSISQNKEKVKARTRFMLGDFFKSLKK